MLDQDYQYFKENSTQLLKKFPGKILLISDKSVKGLFKNEQEAYSEGVKKFGLGNFIIQASVPFTQNIQSFHSRVNIK